MLKLTTDKHEASRGLSAIAELLVILDYQRGFGFGFDFGFILRLRN